VHPVAVKNVDWPLQMLAVPLIVGGLTSNPPDAIKTSDFKLSALIQLFIVQVAE
jgi:hypothetical protein